MATTRDDSTLRRTDTAAAIYGTILTTAVVGGAARNDPPGRILAFVAITLVVFWVAHVYAHTLSHHLRHQSRPRWSTVRTAMAEERTMLEAPAPALLLLALGATGVLDAELAVTLALWAGPVQLVGWGAAFARRLGWGWPMVVVSGAVNGLLGLVVIVLKALVHH